MQMYDIIENILIMLITIVVLLVGIYVLLVLLNWGLKLKGGAREEEGLFKLWVETKKKEESSDQPGSSQGDP